MKLRKAMITAIALSVINSASAMELSNARIIDSKQWISGDKIVEGHFENNNKQFSKDAMVDAGVNSPTGKVKTNIIVYGNHGIQIMNRTRNKQMYTLEYKVCADSSSCLSRIDHVEIGQNGYFKDSTQSALVVCFDNPGSISDYALTKVSGESGDQSEARGTVHVQR